MHKFGNTKFNSPPILLAPMEDVTDSSFRRLCVEWGVDWVVTEFISTEGILRKEDNFGSKLNFLPSERPISIQLFGNNSESLKRAIEMIEPLSPDFIDLNMGCPVKKVVSKGAGAALIKDPDLMCELAKAAVNSTKIPITVKTRIGWDDSNINIIDNALRLQDTGIVALTIHGRTKKQLYGGFANWNVIAEVKNHNSIKVPIIGNGDICDPYQAMQYFNEYNVDGIMIGRASFGNPFIFRQINELKRGNSPSIISLYDRINTVKKHFIMALEWKGESRNILEIRKHYSGYFRNFPNFKPYRLKLMLAKNQVEVFDVLDEIYENYKHDDIGN